MGYLFGYVPFTEVAMYGVGIAIFVPCAILSLVAAREKRYKPTKEEMLEKAQNPKGIKNVLRTLKSFPPMFYFLMFTQLIAW